MPRSLRGIVARVRADGLAATLGLASRWPAFTMKSRFRDVTGNRSGRTIYVIEFAGSCGTCRWIPGVYVSGELSPGLIRCVGCLVRRCKVQSAEVRRCLVRGTTRSTSARTHLPPYLCAPKHRSRSSGIQRLRRIPRALHGGPRPDCGQKRHHAKTRAHQPVGQWVTRRDGIQLGSRAPGPTRARQRRQSPIRSTRPERLPDDQPQNVTRCSAGSPPDANLARALAKSVADDAIDTDTRRRASRAERREDIVLKQAEPPIPPAAVPMVRMLGSGSVESTRQGVGLAHRRRERGWFAGGPRDDVHRPRCTRAEPRCPGWPTPRAPGQSAGVKLGSGGLRRPARPDIGGHTNHNLVVRRLRIQPRLATGDAFPNSRCSRARPVGPASH